MPSDLKLSCYCSAAAKNRPACTGLLFGPGLPNERLHTRFELKLSRCSAAANSGFACTELMSGPGLPTDRAHARFELELPCCCCAAAKSRFSCTELLSGRGLPTERVHARFELKLSCYCSATATNRSACTTGCIPELSWNCPITVLLLQILVLPALNCCLALCFQPTGLMPDLS